MAPTALDKAISERNTTSAIIDHCEQQITDHATVALTQPVVEHLLSLIHASQRDLIDNLNKIQHCNPPDMAPHKAEFQTLFSRLTRALGGLMGINSTFPPPTIPTPTTTSAPQPDIRLPRLELPTFDGNLHEWVSFRDLFVTAVHNNKQLSDSQKLTYLKSQLRGEATRQVQSIIITDANYTIAWKQLSDRYQNDRQLLFAVLKRFTQQQLVTDASSASLRHLIDVSRECIRSLETLRQPTDEWDAILLYHIHHRLDPMSKELYEQSLPDSTIPKLKGLFDFLEQRSRALEASCGLARGAQGNQQIHHQHRPHRPQQKVHHAQTPTSKCHACSDPDHYLAKCQTFLGLGINERFELVKKNHLCFNCLRAGHAISQCPSKGSCRTCQSRHHTLLHRPQRPEASNHSEDANNKPRLNHHASIGQTIDQNLLATAIVAVKDTYGQQQLCRVLLDGGSDAHIISTKCVRKLGLPWQKIHCMVNGLSSTPVGIARGALNVTFSPHFNNSTSITARAIMMPTVTGLLPVYPCNPDLSHLRGLTLADKGWCDPSEVDILIGSGLFYSFLEGDKRIGKPGEPIAIKSLLGWLVAGEIKSGSVCQNIHSSVNVNMINSEVQTKSIVTVEDIDLDRTLRKFWDLETLSCTKPLTPEEKACELHFIANYTQDETGRFHVKIPFKSTTPNLGSSRDQAIQRFKQIERRLASNPTYKEEYTKFMKDYLALGHMEEVPRNEIHSQGTCYIPHHFVLKASSTTTKFRVVFDASAKTTNGLSLNDNMMIGATIQDNLCDIITRFRTHPVAFTADVCKMYRQIRVSPSDANYQRIVWREDPSQPLQDFRLLTVTYGTGSAPFLSTRSVKQLAINEKESLPLASIVAQQDFYVDDVMSGAETIQDVLQVQSQLLRLMERGGMSLRKWTSSHPEVIQALPEELRETESVLPLEFGHAVKTLGIYWSSTNDHFFFKIDPAILKPCNRTLTKRIVLSEIARIFDPIGWLSPVILIAKLLMQQLWKLELGWDDDLPQHFQEQWQQFKGQLKLLENLQIPRCIKPSGSKTLALVGFCDSSELAYSAVAYLCAYSDTHPVSISLVTSKTRVAPFKRTTLPRLELCGAVLLAQLMESIQDALKLNIQHVSAFSDSTVVLHWIQAHPSRWNKFVGNRVAEIQERISPSLWGHVAGTENPADCASRGLDPSTFLDFKLWWEGPSWLKTGIPRPSIVPASHKEIDNITCEEKKIATCNRINITSNGLFTHLQNSSSLLRLQRSTAIVLRFITNLKYLRSLRLSIAGTKQPHKGPLTPLELDEALLLWVKLIQGHEFFAEINCLKSKNQLHPKSKLLCLNPFLDTTGILRVGGRLKNAPLTTDQRHPILLPRHGKLTELIINNEHWKTFHGGPQLLLASLHARFWIVRGRDAIRHQIKKCVTCTKQKAATMQQLMADLPSFRVTPSRAFSKCGIDYAGPFSIRSISPRSKITYKAYICIFICCVTRAVHIEIVSALSTAAFIAALRRFVSRRGRPSDIYSDCGTNFVGASRELKEMAALVNSDNHNEEISNQLSSQGISWHFNPPGAPHFGGLWEAGVRSIKYHLHRVVGASTVRLTYEEFSTTTSQIEAILNSRPLTPQSSDPNDLSVLTPGHFLIGCPLLAIPDPDLTDVKVNRLNRWEHLQQMTQIFWRRWSNEYLARLQQRPKWMITQPAIQVGNMVILKDERLPPMSWRLGRVQEVHPGADGKIRVVTVKTSEGTLKRPITKLCLLPIDSGTDSESD